MRQETNQHGPMTPNGNHSNGTMVPVSLPPQNIGPNTLIHSESMPPGIDDIRVHTPHPSHQIPYSELY